MPFCGGRLRLNLSVEELAARVGISNKTLSNFERTGRCTFETFVRVLEALDALPDLQNVLIIQPLSIEDMRLRVAASTRQRAYNFMMCPVSFMTPCLMLGVID